MDLAQARYIVAIAEKKSFSKAAESLFISQPYLSKIVMRAEQEIGAKIFDRSTAPMTVTPAGECYIEYLKEIIYNNQKMHVRVNDIVGCNFPTIRFGIPQTLGSYLLPVILRIFFAIHPNVKVVIEEARNTDLKERVENGQIDLCLFSAPDYSNSIDYEIIKQEYILLVVPPNHPFGTSASKGNYAKPISFPKEKIHQLSHEKFIILTAAQGIGMFSRRTFERYGITPDIFMETQNIETAYRLAAIGAGLTFIPENCLSFSKFEDEPHYFTIGSPPLKRDVVIAYKKGRFLSKYESDFIKIVHETV